MKHCTKIVFAALCLLVASGSMAQKKSSKKTFLFNDYPAVINCTEQQLAGLFNRGDDTEVSLSLPGNLVLKGPAKIRLNKFCMLQSVAVKLTSFNNILFSVSRRFDRQHHAIYNGHLFSTDYADGYQLKRNNDGSYQLVKIDTDRLLEICSR